MKKFTKIMAKVLPIVLVGLLIVGNVFGVGKVNESELTGGKASEEIGNLSQNIWATVALIVRILAVAAVVFAGLRYMFANANDKADIKKQMITLVIGAILVFGATFVINFIAGASEQVLNGSSN